MSGENKTAASLRAEMEKKRQERDEEHRRQEAEDVRMLQELEEKERMEQEELQRQAAALRKAEAEAKRKASEQRLSQSPVKATSGKSRFLSGGVSPANWLLVGDVIRRPIEGGSEDEDEDEDEDGSGGYRPTAEAAEMSEGSGTKGKGKEIPDPKRIEYTGDERCTVCVRQRVSPCVVDRAVHEKWASDWKAGQAGKRAPDGSSCEACGKARKRCELPATAAYRGETLKRKRGQSEVEAEGKSKRVVPKTESGSGERKAKRPKGSAEASSEHPLEKVLEDLANGVWNVFEEMRLLNFHASRITRRFEQPLSQFLRDELPSEDEDDSDYVSETESEDEADRMLE